MIVANSSSVKCWLTCSSSSDAVDIPVEPVSIVFVRRKRTYLMSLSSGRPVVISRNVRPWSARAWPFHTSARTLPAELVGDIIVSPGGPGGLSGFIRLWDVLSLISGGVLEHSPSLCSRYVCSCSTLSSFSCSPLRLISALTPVSIITWAKIRRTLRCD